MKKIEIILLVLILALGIFLRSPEVINHNPLFGFDQGRDYLAVRKIIIEKKLTLIGPEVGAGMAGLQYIFHGPYYYYLLSLPFIFFSGDPYGGLILMFVFGVASLFIAFYFAHKKFGFQTALILLLLLDVTLSAQSRFIWNSHPTTPLILIFFWLVYKVSGNPAKYFFWATLVAGIIYGFQLAISVSLIGALFFFAILILKVKDLKVYLKGIAGVILSYLPFMAFEFRHGFMAVKSLIKVISGLTFTGVSHILQFWFNFRDSFYLSDRLRFWLFIWLLIVITHFLLREKSSSEKKFISFLLILPLVTYLVLQPLGGVVWGHYLVHLHLVYIFLFAYFFAKSKFPLAKSIFIIFLLLMLPNIYKEIIKAKNDLSDYGGVAKMKGKIEAIDYIYKDAGGEQFNVLVFTPPVYDYAYRYLLEWYGGKKYGFVPGEQKKGLFYLWIEPDNKKPWSYKGWLETVIKTGKVLKEEELPSGFIIQKRYVEE